MNTVIRAMVVGAVLAGVSGTVSAQQPDAAQAQPAAPKPAALTFNDDVALWTIAVKPDKTADFERVMARLHEGLTNSKQPQRNEQGKSWGVVRMAKPLPDGNIMYVHVISPVVPGADYTVMQILYDEFPDERLALYELYRGSFAQNLALVTGDVAIDMAAPAGAPQATAAGN